MAGASFADLPRELRDQIWAEVVIMQHQDIIHSLPKSEIIRENPGDPDWEYLPKSCTGSRAERRRQAFIGYENLEPGTERQPLRLWVHKHHDWDTMRWGVNEFQTFVNCFPMATICTEARSHAVKFCRSQIKLMSLVHATDAPDMPIFEEDEVPVEHVFMQPYDIGDEVHEPAFVRPATVVVPFASRRIDGPVNFTSAQHLVDVVGSIFGDRVETLILKPSFDITDSLDRMYWPHTAQTQRFRDSKWSLFSDPEHPQYMSLTSHRTLYIGEQFLHIRNEVIQHLLKMQEVLDVSSAAFPRLQNIEVELRSYSMGAIVGTHVKAVIKDGTIWVHADDVILTQTDDPDGC